MNRIIKILIERDEMTLEEATEDYEEGRAMIIDSMATSFSEAEEIMYDHFSLEPDYLEDIIF
jgi:exonuclease VII small subunit